MMLKNVVKREYRSSPVFHSEANLGWSSKRRGAMGHSNNAIYVRQNKPLVGGTEGGIPSSSLVSN